MRIRDACSVDVDGIAAIYNDAVARTTAIWNDKNVDSADRAAWLAARERIGYPVLVAVDEASTVLGYASFADWRPWEGYRHTVEHSVYVREDRRGEGIGKALMLVLMDRARILRKHVMIGGIESSNTGSIRLHEGLGFATVGRFSEVGTKFGVWLDLVFMQLCLDDRHDPDDIGDPKAAGRSG